MLPNSEKLHPITAMDITNRIIVALLERMKSRNKNFSLSRPKFHRMFQINPDGYLWYGEKLERLEKPLNFAPFGHARFAHLFVLYD